MASGASPRKRPSSLGSQSQSQLVVFCRPTRSIVWGRGVQQYRIQFSCDREKLNGFPKCLTLKDIRAIIWFPSVILEEQFRKDHTKPIFIAESPGKAAALTNAGFPCIGLAGVQAGWNLRGDSDHLSPEMQLINWKGRLAYQVFDANRATNANVAFAEAKLASVLGVAGANVRLVELPDIRGQDGPDDFLHAQGVEEFKKLVESAVGPDPEARAKACKTKKQAMALVGQFPFLAAQRVVGKRVQLAIRNDWKNRLKVPNSAIKDALELFNASRGDVPREEKRQARATVVNAQGADPIICNEETHIVESKVLAALEMDPDLYVYGGRLVSIRPPTKRRPTSEFRQVTPTVLGIRHMSKVANYLNVKGEKISPPLDIARSIIESWLTGAIREVERIVNVPVMRSNGTVLMEPGYDAETGIILEPQLTVPPIPENPTSEQIQEAKDLLLEVIQDFPVVGSGRSSWLALVLSFFGREMYEGPTPGIAFDGNAAGVGKGMIVQSASMICLGDVVGDNSYVWDEVEIRKKVSTWLEKGIGFVLVDNIPLKAELGNATWDALLTSTRWDDRKLGSNESISVANKFIWSFSGINIVVAKDSKRRIIHCRQETNMEKPAERPASDFLHPELLAWIKQERARLVAAVLTILRGWVCAGRLPGKTPLGSFEGWATTIGGVIEWLGMPSPVKTQSEYEARMGSSGDAGALSVFLHAWFDVFKLEAKKIKEVLSLIETEDIAFREAQKRTHLPKEESDGTIGLEENRSPVRSHQDLKDAMLALCGCRSQRLPAGAYIGRVLASQVNTPAGGLKLIGELDDHTKIMGWRVEEIGNTKSPEKIESARSPQDDSPDNYRAFQMAENTFAGTAGTNPNSVPGVPEPGFSEDLSVAGTGGC